MLRRKSNETKTYIFSIKTIFSYKQTSPLNDPMLNESWWNIIASPVTDWHYRVIQIAGGIQDSATMKAAQVNVKSASPCGIKD